MKGLLECTASDFRTMSKEDMLSAMAGSEGRVLACESMATFSPCWEM